MHPDYVEKPKRSFKRDFIETFLYVAIFSSIVMNILTIGFSVLS